MTTIKVKVPVVVEIDPKDWAETYGLDVALDRPELDAEDIQTVEKDVRGVVQEVADEYIERIGFKP